MRNRRSFVLGIFATLIMAGLWSGALGQSNDNNLANVSAAGSTIRWDVTAPNSGVTLTITAPDGRSFTKEYKSGAAPEFTFTEKQGLPDGSYGYELRLQPTLTAGQKEELKRMRGKDDDPEAERAGRKRPIMPAMVQSGGFALLNGQVIAGGLSEGKRDAKLNVKPAGTHSLTSRKTAASGNTVARLRNHRLSLALAPMFDEVIPDDLIVQGSACVGLDCVSGEVFGFDTIRLKENNTRLQFEDTSASGFPLNNWQIRANSSVAGGQSFLAFVDQGAAGNSETGTIVFQVTAGAPANSVNVASTGKVGFRTSVPVLDLHMNTSDTPAARFEQNNSGGFSAQTWDVAGNEANFFIRDVTGGSRLSFRIRPGAPTSSIDIAASGNVGIGTGSPGQKLHLLNSTGNVFAQIETGGTGASGIVFRRSGASDWLIGHAAATSSAPDLEMFTAGTGDVMVNSGGNERMRIKGGTGNVGIATNAPTDTLSVNGTASKPGGGTWAVFSDERLKNIKGSFTPGLSAVMRLQPLRYQYKANNALNLGSDKDYVGFGAQALQKVLPEAVSQNENGYLQVNSDPILWTMLNAIKEQQKEIEQLKGQIKKLQATSYRRRK